MATPVSKIIHPEDQKKYEEIVKIVNSNSGNDKIIGDMWNKLRLLNQHAISDVIKGTININDRIRARISSRFDSITIKEPTNQAVAAVVFLPYLVASVEAVAGYHHSYQKKPALYKPNVDC